MLTLYEEITEDLTPYEIETVLPLVSEAIKKYKGKEAAITATTICKRMNRSGLIEGYIMNTVKVRKIMGAIRLLGLVHNICSGARGYYVGTNAEEIAECIESLEQRVRQQTRVIEALKSQSRIIK